jgi:hypothetical protein
MSVDRPTRLQVIEMPRPQTQRTIVLRSSFNASTVTELTLTMDATFTTDGGTSNVFEDASESNAEERTKYKSTFVTAGGPQIGEMTLRLVGKGEVTLTGTTVDKTTARSNITPTPTTGSVALLPSPAHSFERVWKQAAKNDAGEVVDNVGKLDVRVLAASGYTVTQTVQSASDGAVVVAYSWLDASGAAAVSGTVTLTASATEGKGYRLGRIRVEDNIPSTGSERVREREARRGR